MFFFDKTMQIFSIPQHFCYVFFITFVSMKMYTEQEALEEIFSIKGLSNQMRVLKARFKKNTLTRKVKDQLLQQYNFTIYQEAQYKKND